MHVSVLWLLIVNKQLFFVGYDCWSNRGFGTAGEYLEKIIIFPVNFFFDKLIVWEFVTLNRYPGLEILLKVINFFALEVSESETQLWPPTTPIGSCTCRFMFVNYIFFTWQNDWKARTRNVHSHNLFMMEISPRPRLMSKVVNFTWWMVKYM